MTTRRLLVNLGGMQLAGAQASLGIAHYTTRALAALRERGGWAIDGVADDPAALREAAPALAFLDTLGRPRAGRGLGAALRRALSGSPARPDAEYLPHPFSNALSETPVLLCCFDLFVVDAPEKYGRHRESRLRHYAESVARARAIVVPFPRTFRMLPSVFPAARGKLFLAACPTLLGDVPLRDEALRSVAERFRLRGDARLVLYPGALHHHKNHVGLIEAAALLVKRGLPVTFVCSGSETSPEVAARIRDALRSFDMEAHVLLPGFLPSEEVRALYEICDLAVSPSHAEGGAAIVQEAVHFGRPVACSGIDAAREHVRWIGADVPFFDPSDPADIARAIERALEDPGRQVAANRAARERVGSWTWEALAQRYAEILDWLADGAHPRARPPAEPA